MASFLISGVALLLYSGIKFYRSKIFYPSVIFSFMWGMACVMTTLILGGAFEHLYLADYYSFKYIDRYILWFTAISLFAFWFAHRVRPGNEVNLDFNLQFIDAVVDKYKWIMWLNFFGGILRIILMINLVGFDSVMDYRVAANNMMNTGFGTVGLIFRITSYIQMLANFYVAICGFKTGFESLDLKKTLILFILYAPTQMATGGRLFILYFILFFIGSFLLGRGVAMKFNDRILLEKEEKKVLSIISIGFLTLVAIIAMARAGNTVNHETESAFAKFTYISEGMLETEHYMRFDPPETHVPDYGKHLFTGKSFDHLQYRGYLQMTYMSSIVISIMTPLYTSFGFYGSIFVWGAIAFILELIAIMCLRRLSIIRFFVFLTILKIMYETVIASPIPGNIPVYELIILFMVFYKPIFGNIEHEHS